jgi:Protein of function (DUF2518)
MLSPESFLIYTQWCAWAMLACGVVAGLAFVFKWGFRFRLVGVTSFMGVLTVGLFALTLMPLSQTVVPGAGKYSLVYDTGAANVVIAVPPTLTKESLEATLKQAAGNLFSTGRSGQGNTQLLIRARTVIHPEAGVSVPLYLGQIQRSLSQRNDSEMVITVFDENLARLPKIADSSHAG